jgi:hypothetical protein
MPPPGHSHGRSWIHQDTVMKSHKPQGFRGGNNGEQVRPSIYITKVQINHLSC